MKCLIDPIVHQISDIVQKWEKASMFDELSDETQRFLYGDTAHEIHYMRVVPLWDFLYGVNFLQKIFSLYTTCKCCRYKML